MAVDHITGLRFRQQQTDLTSCSSVDRCGLNSGQRSRQRSLASTIPPNLGNDTSARAHGHPLELRDTKHRPDGTVVLIDGDERAGVEDEFHATFTAFDRLIPSARAAAFSSASVKAPSAASHSSRAAPRRSLRSLSAVACATQAETLMPDRRAASRTACPSSGSIVTENRSTFMHTTVIHTTAVPAVASVATPPSRTTDRTVRRRRFEVRPAGVT